MSNPNLFKYATKELSQDALICWLIKSSEHHEDAELKRLGRHFVAMLLSKSGRIGKDFVLDECDNVKAEVYQQVKRIDVLARVNGQHVLLIEDKTVSSAHDDQLARYRYDLLDGKTPLGSEVSPSDLYPIYFKTGNYTYAEKRNVEERFSYDVFDRRDFLKVLNSYSGRNSIVVEFRDYLQSLEDLTYAFRNWSDRRDDPNKNDWETWKGFYRELEEEFWDRSTERDWMERTWPGWGSWNTLREVMVFWWRPPNLSPSHRGYLQLNRDGLYFMINAEDSSKEERQKMRSNWYNRIPPLDDRVSLPLRQQASKNIKIAQYRHSYLKYDCAGKFDFRATVNELKSAEQILLNAIKNTT